MGDLILIVVAVVVWFILATMVLPAATINLIEPEDVAGADSYGYVLLPSICGCYVTHKRYYQVMVRHGPP